MQPTTTSGSYGQAFVGTSNIVTVMANWSIPEQFREQAVKSVSLLLLATAEGSFLAQTFRFDIPSGTFLSTLLVVATKIHSPADPNLPFSVTYVTMNTNAQLIQLTSTYTVRRCFTCSNCFWVRRCCCKNDAHWSARGHTMEELNIVKQKMATDQFAWFNRQNLSSNASNSLVKRTVPNGINYLQDISLARAVENFLSNPSVKAEVLASYNDSLLTAIQSNFTSMKLSSSVLKLNRIERKHLGIFLTTLANEHGFDDFYSNPQYSEQLKSPRFSYENLYTSQNGTRSSDLVIRYIWVFWQATSNSTYALNFVSLNITSKILIETMLSNNTKDTDPSSAVGSTKQLNIVRTSTFASNGEFLNENLLKQITPWQQNTTRTVLNMLRFLTGSVLVPQKFRMLSYFDPEIVLPGTKFNNSGVHRQRNIALKIKALASAVSVAASATKDVINTLKSSRSTTITRIVRFGFNYFNQRSTMLKAIDIPGDRVNEFVNAVIMDYNLPSRGSFMLGLTYSDDFAWDRIQYLYSPAMNGTYRSLTLFKNGDSVKNTASFFIVDINADWEFGTRFVVDH